MPVSKGKVEVVTPALQGGGAGKNVAVSIQGGERDPDLLESVQDPENSRRKESRLEKR